MQLSDTVPAMLCLLAAVWAGWLWLAFRKPKLAALLVVLVAVTLIESYAVIQSDQRGLFNELTAVGIGLLCLALVMFVEQLMLATHESEKFGQISKNNYSELELALDEFPLAVFVKDAHFQTKFVNQQYKCLWSLAESEEIEIDERNPFPEKLIEEDRLSDQALINSGEQQEYSQQLARRDGSPLTLRVVKKPLFDSQGNVCGLVGMHEDISLQKESELAHQIELEKILKLNYARRSLTPQVDASLNCNQQAIEILTIAGSEALQGDRVTFWMFDEHQQKLKCTTEFGHESQSKNTGMELSSELYPKFFQELKKSLVFNITNVSADSRTVELADNFFVPRNICSVLIAPVQLSGTVRGFLFVEHAAGCKQWREEECTYAADLAEQAAKIILYNEYQTALLEYQEYEQKYHTMQQRSFDATAVVQGRKLLESNQRFEEMLGWTQQELLNLDFRELLHPDVREELMKNYRQLKSDQRNNAEFRTSFIHKDGTRIDVNLQIGTVSHAKKPATLIIARELEQRDSHIVSAAADTPGIQK